MSVPWTEREEEIMRSHYVTGGSLVVQEMTGRSRPSILHKARAMGLGCVTARKPRKPDQVPPRAPRETDWTAAEVETLRTHYPKRGAKAVADMLGRSRISVQQKASAMAVRRHLEMDWPAHEIAALREHYPTKGSRFVAELTGRSRQAVLHQATRLGVKVIGPGQWMGRERPEKKPKPPKVVKPKHKPRPTAKPRHAKLAPARPVSSSRSCPFLPDAAVTYHPNFKFTRADPLPDPPRTNTYSVYDI